MRRFEVPEAPNGPRGPSSSAAPPFERILTMLRALMERHGSVLDLDATTHAELWRRVAELMQAHASRLCRDPDAPIVPSRSNDAIAADVAALRFDVPRPPEALVEELARALAKGIVHPDHPPGDRLGGRLDLGPALRERRTRPPRLREQPPQRGARRRSPRRRARGRTRGGAGGPSMSASEPITPPKAGTVKRWAVIYVQDRTPAESTRAVC